MANVERPADATLLIVDDDPRIRHMLGRYFEDEGFRVITAQDGAEMREALRRTPVDIVLLDLVLPGEDGFTLARELGTRPELGIVMLTGRGDMIDRVVGLELGADDYIAKPFHLREVLARVKSVLRRMRHDPRSAPATARETADTYHFEGWFLDMSRRRLTSPAGTDVPLTSGEFDLLAALLTHAGRVMDRDSLMDLTRGRTWDAFDRSIDAMVSRLRKKIEIDPKDPVLLKSVRGVGYILAVQVRRG